MQRAADDDHLSPLHVTHVAPSPTAAAGEAQAERTAKPVSSPPLSAHSLPIPSLSLCRAPRRSLTFPLALRWRFSFSAPLLFLDLVFSSPFFLLRTSPAAFRKRPYSHLCLIETCQPSLPNKLYQRKFQCCRGGEKLHALKKMLRKNRYPMYE